ncbi:DUF3331 domain-containing protein [Burkholderia contaminans]|nr:DUF3331 domain-containing protein [Burkholderia contaminans]
MNRHIGFFDSGVGNIVFHRPDQLHAHARCKVRNHENFSSSLDGHSCDLEISEDPLINRAKLTPVVEIEPEERWRRMMQSLKACSDGTKMNLPLKDCTVDLPGKNALGDRSRCSATVDILDQLSSSTVVISWRNSTGGHYGHQTWHKGCARRSGLCAASGMPINPGDEIFRPSVRNSRPTNWSAMILALHISRIDFSRIVK